MRGRPPKPTKLKILAGNPGRRPLPKNEPQPRVGAPSCPAWLSGEAKAEWRRIVKELEPIGLVTMVDRAALSAYCQAWAELREATRQLDREGRVIESPVFNRSGDKTGTLKKLHPAVRLQRDAFTRVKQFLVEFGLSPASRPKLAGTWSADKPAEEVDELQDLINRGKAQA